MTRARSTPATRERRKKILKQAKGFYGLRYSSLIRSLKLARIELDPKQLSELAIHQPELLNKIIDTTIK
ncbi:2046_t:CDS:2 [Entrophospora sp. SA101]|nr:2046_t:CDS:2 [Entrophospora sp. SA101]